MASLAVTESGRARMDKLDAKLAEFDTAGLGLVCLPDREEANDWFLLHHIENYGDLEYVIDIPQVAPQIRATARRLHEAGMIEVVP